MARMKFDNTGVEDVTAQPAPIGTYRAKIRSMEPKQSKNDNAMVEVIFDLTHDAGGKKLKESYDPIWYYPISDHDHPYVKAQWKEFTAAVTGKTKGILDTDKDAGKSVLVKLGTDTDQDGEYRPRVKKVMPLVVAEEEEPEPVEEPDEEPEPDEEEQEGVDLDTLSRAQLKALIKEEELEIRVLKSMDDDAIRAAIAAAMAEDDDEEEEEEDEDEPEDEEEEGEPEGDGYDEMAVSDLKAELKERELPTNGAKKILIARLRKDDGDQPF